MSNRVFILSTFGLILITMLFVNSSRATKDTESISFLECTLKGKCKVRNTGKTSIGEYLGTSKMANCPSTCQIPLDQTLIKAYSEYLKDSSNNNIISVGKTITLNSNEKVIAVLKFNTKIATEEFLSKTRLLIPSLDNDYKPILDNKVPVWRSYSVDR